MKRIAIIAALPGELEPLVSTWKRRPAASDAASGAPPPRTRSDNAVIARGSYSQSVRGPSGEPPLLRHVHLWRRRQGNTEIVAVCAGAGLKAARRAFAAAEALGPLDVVVSIGWAGALRPAFQAGRAYHITGVVDAQTGEAFPTSAHSAKAWLATSHQVAGKAEKGQLAKAYQADLVDMEATAIARLAAARRIPFYCIKGVSDGALDHLPDFNRFIGKTGQFKFIRFILFAALRPWWWSALIKLGRQSKQAAQGLNLRLAELLKEQKSDYG